MIPIQFNSDLPFLTFSFAHWDLSGREQLSVLVKGVFSVDEQGQLAMLRDNAALAFSDGFYGDPHSSPLAYESDLAPFKPKTDITFNAVARAPESKELPGWPVRFDVAGRLSYGFHVQGKRQFEPLAKPNGRDWRLSGIMPITALPLRYDYAYGGTVPVSDEKMDAYAYNPVGRGFVSDYLLQRDEPIAAPQIGVLAELNAMKIAESIGVHGCGSVTKSWLPRLSLAGTLNEAWQRDRHPLMPENFDYAYWNAAPLPLQLGPYLQGDETVTMQGLLHDPRPYSFRLPGAGISCRVHRDSQAAAEHYALNLDTLHCDVASENTGQHRITLVWRIVLHEPDTIAEVVLHPRTLNTGQPLASPASIAARKKCEDEKARRELIEEKKRLATIIEKSGMTMAEISTAFAAPAVATLANKTGKRFELYSLPRTKQPVIVKEGTKVPVHIGDSRYLYQLPPMQETESFPLPATVMKIDEEHTIYVRLLDDELDIWRPAKALWHGNHVFHLLLAMQQDHIRKEEKWEFAPGMRVVCERRAAETGGIFIAVSEAGNFR